MTSHCKNALAIWIIAPQINNTNTFSISFDFIVCFESERNCSAGEMKWFTLKLFRFFSFSLQFSTLYSCIHISIERMNIAAFGSLVF